MLVPLAPPTVGGVRSAPYDLCVSVTLAAVLGCVVGLALAGVAVWARRRPPRADPDSMFAPPEPRVPDQVAAVLDVLPSTAVVVGPHDEVLQSSAPARTLGVVRGSRVVVPELLDLVRQVRLERDIRTLDVEVGADAAAVFLSARVAPLDDNLILLLAEDRTAARRVDESRRDFVANVSHELKTPIGAIALLAEAVEQAADDPDAVHRFASRMSKESVRLTDLVGQIIQLSRLQADEPLLRAEEVDVDTVVSAAVDRCRVDAEQRGVALMVGVQRGLQVLGSAAQLENAVGNLVENAVIYSDAGARVAVGAHLETSGDDDWVEITVSDNGIGIAREDLGRVFERFYRVDYARSRANGGTGLGLSIVKHIAAVHGGEVSVWSQLGQGSTFTIRLPAQAAAAEPAAPAVDSPHPVRSEPAAVPSVAISASRSDRQAPQEVGR